MMKTNLIKFWSQKAFWLLTIVNLVIMVTYSIITGILISNLGEKLINIFTPLIINIIILAILYIFTFNNITTTYQLKTSNTDQPKISRFLLIIFAFIWLIFFISISFYMFGESIDNQIKLDYFAALQKNWWKAIIISLYNTSFLILHRQLLWWTIEKQKLPWENLLKKIKKDQKTKKDFNEN